MAEPLSHILGNARSRWMIGGDGPAPDHPLAAGQSAGEADLRLLAVAGQHQRLCRPPQPPVLTLRPDLPAAPLPSLPEALRPLARRMLGGKVEEAPLPLARFVAHRGHVLHPADWMPPPEAELPVAYRPWQLWRAGRTSDPPLTAGTWLDHRKSDRLSRFAALRRADPAAARALLAAQAAAASAEERQFLVEALGDGLGPEDIALLEGLASDRSERVRRAARQMLARLGQGGDDPRAHEAVQMFEVAAEGLIRRRKVLRLSPKAKEAQLRSLAQTLPEISLAGLAASLDLTPMQFVELWTPEKVPPHIHEALALMIARSAGDAEAALWWRRHLELPDTARFALHHLYSRLPEADRQGALMWLIAQNGLDACAEILARAGVGAPPPVSAALAAQRRDLADLIERARDATPEKAQAARAEARRLTVILGALGLLLTAGDAALVLETLTAAGLHPADPQLDRLTLNAALKGS